MSTWAEQDLHLDNMKLEMSRGCTGDEDGDDKEKVELQWVESESTVVHSVT